MIFALFNAAMAFDFAQPRERLFTRGGSVFIRKIRVITFSVPETVYIFELEFFGGTLVKIHVNVLMIASSSLKPEKYRFCPSTIVLIKVVRDRY